MEFLTVQGDITDQIADALVNSINSSCYLEHGVARAFRLAAGQQLQDALLEVTPENPAGGRVFVTDAFDLDTEYVIHAVAVPIPGGPTEASIREAATNALVTADERDCESIAFPLLGAGHSRYDTRETAQILCSEIAAYEPTHQLHEALIVGYSAEGYETLRTVAWDVRTER